MYEDKRYQQNDGVASFPCILLQTCTWRCEQEALETRSMKPELWLRYSHLMAPQPFRAWLDLWLSTPGMSLRRLDTLLSSLQQVWSIVFCALTVWQSLCILVWQTGILSMQCSEHGRLLINRKIEDSAVATHASGNYHNIDWENSIILDHEHDFFKRSSAHTEHNNFNQKCWFGSGPNVDYIWLVFWYCFVILFL